MGGGSRISGHAAIGHTDDHPWLFPGGRAGKPISPEQLVTRLTRLGISARAGRAAALMDLAAQLPAVVLSKLLGINLTTATAWNQAAGNTRPACAAQVARRPLCSLPRSEPVPLGTALRYAGRLFPHGPGTGLLAGGRPRRGPRAR